MKRIQELTAIRYRRVRKPAPSETQTREPRSRCPVCGGPLEAILINEPPDAHANTRKIALRPIEECGNCSKKLSA